MQQKLQWENTHRVSLHCGEISRVDVEASVDLSGLRRLIQILQVQEKILAEGSREITEPVDMGRVLQTIRGMMDDEAPDDPWNRALAALIEKLNAS